MYFTNQRGLIAIFLQDLLKLLLVVVEATAVVQFTV